MWLRNLYITMLLKVAFSRCSFFWIWLHYTAYIHYIFQYLYSSIYTHSTCWRYRGISYTCSITISMENGDKTQYYSILITLLLRHQGTREPRWCSLYGAWCVLLGPVISWWPACDHCSLCGPHSLVAFSRHRKWHAFHVSSNRQGLGLRGKRHGRGEYMKELEREAEKKE